MSHFIGSCNIRNYILSSNIGLQRKGPVFMTAFRPLCTLLTAIMGLLILREALHLGMYIHLLASITSPIVWVFFFYKPFLFSFKGMWMVDSDLFIFSNICSILEYSWFVHVSMGKRKWEKEETHWTWKLWANYWDQIRKLQWTLTL